MRNVNWTGRESCFRVADPTFLLDSDICIYALRDANGIAALRLSDCVIGSVVTSTIVYAEVMRGYPPEEVDSIAAAHHLFDLINPLPFDRSAADLYARLPFKRASFDRLIAAHALSLGLVLVTNNKKDFTDIPGLKIENWAA